MFNQHVAYRMWIVLHRVYLLINCPPQRLSELCRYLTHSGHILRTIPCVVCEYDAYEVLS